MSGPLDPRQMPPDQLDQGQPPPRWRVVDPAGPGVPAGPVPHSNNYPPHSGYQSGASYPAYPDHPAYPGYSGYSAEPSAPPQMPPGAPAQWGPGPASQRRYLPEAQWREDPSREWAGWSQSNRAPFAPPYPAHGFPELEPLEALESRRLPNPLLVAVGVVMALVLLAVAGAGIAFTQYRAPANAAAGFCNHITSQDYGATYEDLATSIQAHYAPDAFVTSARLADKLLGAVTTCTAATDGSSYHFSLGQPSAQVPISLTRAQAGSFSEVVTLIPDHGRWRLQRLDTGLFGLDLAPLVVASTFCVVLRAHDYAALYGLLDAHARGSVKQDDFVRQGALHEQIDGAVSGCDVLGVLKTTSASSLSVTIGVTRPQMATEQGTVTVTLQHGMWQIDSFSGNLLGSDLGPLTVGQQFCSALSAGNYAAAYALVTDRFRSGASEQQFAYDLSAGGLVKYTGCTPDYTSYKVSGGTASYTTNLQAIAPAYGVNAARGFQFAFVKQGNRWLLDDVTLVY